MSEEAKKTPQKIMVVDDDRALRNPLVRKLKRIFPDAEVSGFENPNDALSQFRTANSGGTPYELLVTDFQMPQMNGDELVSKIRKISPDIPVIIVSGEIESARSALTARETPDGIAITKNVQFVGKEDDIAGELKNALEKIVSLPEKAEKNPRHIKVLIVDSDERTASMMEKFVKANARKMSVEIDINVETRPGEAAALFATNSTPFDLAILGHRMQEASGVDIVSSIVVGNPQQRVIMYSDDPESAEEGLRARGVTELEVLGITDTSAIQQRISRELQGITQARGGGAAGSLSLG